jgi:hypothetical protein
VDNGVFGGEVGGDLIQKIASNSILFLISTDQKPDSSVPAKFQINHRTLNIIFIGAEAIVAILLIALTFHFADTTANMFVDILLAAGGVFLAASLPVWGHELPPQMSLLRYVIASFLNANSEQRKANSE